MTMEPIIVPTDAKGERFDRFLREAFPETSRTALQRRIEAGEILLDGKPVDSHRFLKGGETVTFVEGKRKEEGERRTVSVPIIAVEKDFLIAAKPAGIAVHAGAGITGPTLADAMLVSHPEIAAVGPAERPGIVHRLDKDVSGLMIVARTEQGLGFFKEAFKGRRVSKTYLALVHGSVSGESGTIDRPIARSTRRARMSARSPGQEGKEAITHWEVLRRFTNATFLSVRIETGRTHQIRAHLFSLGHPIVGDPLYKQQRLKLKDAPARPFLHASALAFTDPDGVERAYQSPLPTELEDFLGSLKEVKPST